MNNDRAIYSVANALDLPIGDQSVHMIATSPPYWGLRSYDTGEMKHAELGAEKLHDCLAWARGDEPCDECYVCCMRTWAREMWRVLRDDGVMFLNLGDSYYNYRPGGTSQTKQTLAKHNGAVVESSYKRGAVIPGLKEKDLVGIPWRVALALQADGWYLRSDIVWSKPNPMPESVKDRPTKAHEYVFLLTKSARYFWDAEAVREDSSEDSGFAKQRANGINTWKYNDAPERIQQTGQRIEASTLGTAGRRNIRSVWTIATTPYAGAHFATWPPALVERMIRAGTSERGVCPECGAPHKRVIEKSAAVNAPRNPNDVRPYDAASGYNNGNGATTLHKTHHVETVEWRPTCAHAAAPAPATVLDPFAGSGTTLMVARKLGRVGLGFDLSYTYLYENARPRLGHDKLTAWGRGIRDDQEHDDLPLFVNANGVTQ
jgi:DNA modification methylase